MTDRVCAGFSTVLTIDLGAVRANYRRLAALVAPAACGAVVKADAYGLGAKQVVAALAGEGCRNFFVAQLKEAFEVKSAAGEAVIFVLNGVDPGAEAACAEAGFIPVLNSNSQVARWRALARQKRRALPAALQIDSGMTRLGLDAEDAEKLAADPEFAGEVSLQLVMTHLACADETTNPANAAQQARFAACRALFPDVRASIANSGGAFLPAGFHLDLARPGLALYGVAPQPDATGLKAVLKLEARVIQIRDVAAGVGVGYGLEHVTPSARRLATVGIGYADGWPRSLGRRGAAYTAGVRLPIVGRVSMDSLIVDITELPDGALCEGDLVELLGPAQSAADVARDAGTIAYEILTRLGPRHARIYIDETAAPEGVT